MKGKLDTILFLTLALLSVAGIVIGVVGDSTRRAGVICPCVKVSIPDRAVNKFVDEKGVVKLIDSLYGGYVNVPAEEINLWKMEKVLGEVDFVETATCYVTRDGVLNVEVTQTVPVAKFNSDRGLVYIGGEGKCMKVNKDWNNRLICLEGKPSLSDRKWMKDMGSCCGTILQTAAVARRVRCVECMENGECIMFLGDREEKFIIGKPGNIEKKLGKILWYERGIAPKPYETVDLRFKGQIICK